MRAALRLAVVATVALAAGAGGLGSTAHAASRPGPIVSFDDTNFALYSMVPGANPRAQTLIFPIVADPRSAGEAPHSPKWSPNGETLAFTAIDGSADHKIVFGQKIVLTDRRGRVLGELLKGTHINIAGIAWSPDGHQIAYTCGAQQDPTTFEVCVVDVATGAHHALTSNGSPNRVPVACCTPVHPNISWSRNGTDIVFEGWHTNPMCPNGSDPPFPCPNPALYIVNAHSGAVTQLTNFWAQGPQYSPDGSEILYWDNSGVSGYQMMLYEIMPATGGAGRVFLSAAGHSLGRDPTWSPDGKQILYPSMCCGANNGNTDLFTVNVTGPLDRTQITDTPNSNDEPTWAQTLSTCTVPKLKGKTLAKAKALIKRGGCVLGTVTGARSKHVVNQKPAPNSNVATGTKVKLHLG